MIQTGRHHEIFTLADGRELTRKCSALLMGIICRKSLVAEFMGRDVEPSVDGRMDLVSELRQSQGSGFWVTARDRRLFQGAGPSGVSCWVLEKLPQVSHAAPGDCG